jgi:uncharacterized protein
MSQLKFNVAQLLRETIGTRRDTTFEEPLLALDDSLTLREISGKVRFTRTATGVYAHVQAHGVVRMECVRSLEEFDYPVELDFSDEFHSVIDVFTGGPLGEPPEEDPFFLTDQHMADLGDAIRAYTLLALPMNPVSPAYRDAPVSYTVESEGIEDEEVEVDERLSALKAWAQRQSDS